MRLNKKKSMHELKIEKLMSKGKQRRDNSKEVLEWRKENYFGGFEEEPEKLTYESQDSLEVSEWAEERNAFLSHKVL